MERSTSAKPEVILQPKDLYAERCLPSLIGTEEFRNSERLGLVEYISDGWYHWQLQPVSCKLIGCSVWYMYVCMFSVSLSR